MSRPGPSSVNFSPVFPSLLAKYLAAVLAWLLATSMVSAAQSAPKGNMIASVLGPHVDRARGCVVCHPAHSGEYSIEPGRVGAACLWGGNAGPDYGATVALTDGARFSEVHPRDLASASEKNIEDLVCLSCHDGSLTPTNMMQTRPYESQVGLLARTPYAEQEIATLVETDEIPARQHPVGESARIRPGNGLVWANGGFSVIPGSPYAQFVANYGWPALAPRERYKAQGVSHSGEPYVMCTTCHDQHSSNAYVSRTGSPIAGDGGGKIYTTYFFVNGPYNPAKHYTGQQSSSASQFCRQCHFDKANEAHNTNYIQTVF